MRLYLTLLLLVVHLVSFSQTLGGRTAYNFLKLSPSPMITALGGANISYNTAEVSLAANNPATLSPALTSQTNASFNGFLGGIKGYSLTSAYHSDKFNVTFGGHVYFVDYGTIPSTDAAGSNLGEFRPVDFVVQFSAGKTYLTKWRYGGSVKLIRSTYLQYNSTAIALDFGLLYVDSTTMFTAGLLAKNMGFQIKSFADENEDLPFDLQLGITKRLANAPFGFSLTAHHLHRYHISYNDENFINDNGYKESGSLNNLFNHLVIATHIYLGQNLEASFGYDHLRRNELSVPEGSSGLTGFSAGLRLKYNKLQVMYARASYQKGISHNQIGISIPFGK